MKFSVKLLLSLILVTLVVISSYRLWGDQKRLVLSSDKFGFFATNDQFQGGASLSSLSQLEQGAQLDCTLKKSDYAWPYCGVSVHFNSDPQLGLDLSDYHTLELDIDYDIPPNDDRSLRIYFRNYKIGRAHV